MNILRINEKVHPVYWVHNFLSDNEIEKIKKYTEDILEEDAQVGEKFREEEKKPFTVEYHIKDPNIGKVPRKRIANIKWIELNSETNWLYKKIINQIHKVNQENFDMILKFVENLQFSEYTESQQGFYTKHNDCGDKGELENFVDIRKLSFSIQLTDKKEYEGGELEFQCRNLDDPTHTRLCTEIMPKGSIVVFPSFVWHRVKPVTKGRRYSLVVWHLGEPFR